MSDTSTSFPHRHDYRNWAAMGLDLGLRGLIGLSLLALGLCLLQVVTSVMGTPVYPGMGWGLAAIIAVGLVALRIVLRTILMTNEEKDAEFLLARNSALEDGEESDLQE